MSSETKKKSIIKKAPKHLSLQVPVGKRKGPSIYEKDFYKWAVDQSTFLKRKEFSKLDIDNLMEEIESLGGSERRALESHFIVLLVHLLKIKYQSDYRTRSWEHSIKASRFQINKLLKRSPSLKKELSETLNDAYYLARLKAADETSLPDSKFPETCLWTFEQCMNDAGLLAENIVKEKKSKKKG